MQWLPTRFYGSLSVYSRPLAAQLKITFRRFLLSLKHNAQLRLMRVSGDRWVVFFHHSKKTGAKTRPCFTGFKHALHVIRLDFLHKVLVSFLVLSYNLFERYFSQ